jgi:hypothetical protein
MGRTCGTYGGEEKCITGIRWGNLREGDHLKDLSVDGNIILKWIFERLDGDMNWINLAQDRDRWRDLVNAVMNLRVPLNAGNFLSSSGRFSFSGRTLLHGVSIFVRSQMRGLFTYNNFLNVVTA